MISPTLKKFYWFAGLVLSAIGIFIVVYAECSWGGCSSNATQGAMLVSLMLLLAGAVLFFVWLPSMLKVCFTRASYENGVEQNRSRDILVSIISLVLLGIVSYFLYNRIGYEIDRYLVTSKINTSNLLITAFFLIFGLSGAVGLWLHRRWGAFFAVTLIAVVTILNLIRLMGGNPAPHAVIVVVGVILSILIVMKFKRLT